MAEIITMPKLGFDMAEGTLIRWAKAEGEVVGKGELLAEIETDKATVEVESQFSGTVRKHLVSAGAIVPVNDPIAVIGAPDEEIDFDALVGSPPETVETPVVVSSPAQPTPAAATPLPAPAAPQEAGRLPKGVRASPLARRMAQENNLEVAVIAGTGPNGRIIKRDVEAHLASPSAARLPGISALPALSAVELGAPPADQHVPLTRLRQAIGRRMVQAKQDLPHFYVTHEYDMAPVMDARRQANLMLAESGEKLSINDFIVKATALALRQYPNLNASLDGDHVLQHGQVNMGVAVAVPGGLLTVVSHDADRKSLRQISQEIKDKAGRARSGKVRPDDVSGSTFSVSNLGMFDVDHFIAIINPPEAAILALGSAKQVPVVADGHIKPGWRMQATISVDHRVSDGAEAAQFMQALAVYLENPISLLLQLS